MTAPVVLHVAAVEYTAARLLRPQLSHLVSIGYDVRLACAPENVRFSDELAGFHPVRLTFPRTPAPRAMGQAAMELRRLVHRLGPSLVHFHSPAAAMPGRLALAPSRHRPRLVYTVHGFLHTWDSGSAKDRVIAQAERVMSRWTDATLFQSAEDYENARLASYKGCLIPLGNGVSDVWFDAVRNRPRRGPLHAIFVGRLTREKGVGELLAAARQLPSVRWTIVGDSLPSDRDAAREQVARFAGESNGRVRWVGSVSAEAVRSHLVDADLFVLPSWREGLPRSIIEAMASGLPVVATDIRGCRELVDPGVNGWLVPAGDFTALARAIRRAADLPVERLAAMGAAGRARAWKNHRERDVFDRIAHVYRRLGVRP